MNSLMDSVRVLPVNDNLIDTAGARKLADEIGEAEAKAQAGTPAAETKSEETLTSGPARISLVIRKFRVMVEITPRDLADQIGITTREFVAFEAGKECGSAVLVKIIAWLLASS